MTETPKRPKFVDEISDANYFRRKNVILLTGNVNDIFYNERHDTFLSLEQELFAELQEKFTVIRVDMSVGMSFFDSVFDADFSSGTEKELERVCKLLNVAYSAKSGGLKKYFQESRHNPLATLVLLKQLSDIFRQAKRMGAEQLKPLCIIVQRAGSLFPAGSPNHLSELDRQRLDFFLGWISDPAFQDSSELIVLVNRVRSEVNGEIIALSNVTHIEIPLPDENERGTFIQKSASNSEVSFERDKEKFASDTAGLTLNSISDLIEVATIARKPVTQKDVLDEVNLVIRAAIGDIVKIKRPTHKPEDVIGYQKTGEIIAGIFERCEDPELAVSAILVSGPNGGGKTYQLEAYAARSGRIVMELTGLRDSLFGGTDKLFEQLRWYIVTLGKVLILIDEAHTAFGSVHSKDTHETEKRLAGNLIKLMGDPSLRGKILWALMTSRPDELDPDVKSRAPIQIPVFDLEGDERSQFVAEMLRRKKVEFSDAELNEIMERTEYYSARDYDNFIREVRAHQKKSPAVRPHEVLSKWQASRSIQKQRTYQTLIAALHCSYPELLPEALRGKEEEIQATVEEVKLTMR